MPPPPLPPSSTPAPTGSAAPTPSRRRICHPRSLAPPHGPPAAPPLLDAGATMSALERPSAGPVRKASTAFGTGSAPISTAAAQQCPPARTSSGGPPSTPSSTASAWHTTMLSTSGGRPATPSTAFARPTPVLPPAGPEDEALMGGAGGRGAVGGHP
ncbi:uncharacterized protein [Miscanthus floridulus]|uniref:uncharacterized protein n=1 Tax=Miscanthus floridulus TaxID=154761 RepID=UPI003459D6F7